MSALNYLLLTGEAEPLKVIDPELKTARPDIVKRGRSVPLSPAAPVLPVQRPDCGRF